VKFRTKYLYVALSAGLTAAAIAPASALAFSVDAENDAIVTDDAGDSLIFPFYTTSTGLNELTGVDAGGNPVTINEVTDARSSFSVTNTSSSRSLVVKIRFREQFTSQEVFDFLVFLSPEDKFDFWVKQNHDPATGEPTEPPRLLWNSYYDASGNLIVGTSETSCIAPRNLAVVKDFNTSLVNVFREPAYPIPQVQQGLVTLNEALAVGHVEVIAMADISEAFVPAPAQGVDNASLAQMITHSATTFLPPDCADARDAFATLEAVEGIDGLEDAPNVLIGRMLVTVPSIGLEAGTNAIPIKNTFDDPMASAQSDELCESIVPDYPDVCEPKFRWDRQAFSHPHFGDADPDNIENIERQLQAAAVQNDWSRTEATGASVDWVISFPTKYLYTDICDPSSPNVQWCFVDNVIDPDPWTPWDGWGWDYQQNPVPVGCLESLLTVWDWDEYQDGTISPNPNPDLCAEVNVLNIREASTTAPSSFIQADNIRQEFVFEHELDRPRGWAEAIFYWGNWPTYPSDLTIESLCPDDWNWTGWKCTPPPYGAAVAGLAFTVRATGDPQVNNASFTDLSRNDPRTVEGVED